MPECTCTPQVTRTADAMKRWLIAVIAVVALGGIAYFLWLPVQSARRPDDATQLSLGEALTIMRVGRGDIVRYLTASGNLRPGRQVDLRFSVSGRVEEVLVSVGDRVSKGTALVRLDNRQQELAYQQAKTNYEIALLDAAPNVIRERAYDMEVAYDNLQRTVLSAPFDGLVTDVLVEPGQSVGTSDVVVRMIDDSVYKVDVAIDELDIGAVRVGQRAVIVLDADRNNPRSGVVEHIGLIASVQQGMVTVPVTIRLDEVDPFLRPGFSATVQIAVTEARQVVRVPVEAINTASGMNTVTKVVNDEPVAVPVQVGVTDGVWVEVIAGLEEGDEIVGLNYRSRTVSGTPGAAGRGPFQGASPVAGPGMGLGPLGRLVR